MRQCRVVDQSTLPYRGTKLQRYFQNLTLKERQQNLTDKRKVGRVQTKHTNHSKDMTIKGRHDYKGVDLVAGVTIMCEGIGM